MRRPPASRTIAFVLRPACGARVHWRRRMRPPVPAPHERFAYESDHDRWRKSRRWMPNPGTIPIGPIPSAGADARGRPRGDAVTLHRYRPRFCTPPSRPWFRREARFDAGRRTTAFTIGRPRRRHPPCAAGAHVRRPVPACPLPDLDRAAAPVRTIAIAFRPARGPRSLRRRSTSPPPGGASRSPAGQQAAAGVKAEDSIASGICDAPERSRSSRPS